MMGIYTAFGAGVALGMVLGFVLTIFVYRALLWHLERAADEVREAARDARDQQDRATELLEEVYREKHGPLPTD